MLQKGNIRHTASKKPKVSDLHLQRVLHRAFKKFIDASLRGPTKLLPQQK